MYNILLFYGVICIFITIIFKEIKTRHVIFNTILLYSKACDVWMNWVNENVWDYTNSRIKNIYR